LSEYEKYLKEKVLTEESERRALRRIFMPKREEIGEG
jgi:hypothetical protein